MAYQFSNTVYPGDVSTSGAGATTIYTSPVLKEGQCAYVIVTTMVSTSGVAQASIIITEALVARAIGGNVRLADTNFQRGSGEIVNAKASQNITVSAAAQTYMVNVVGSTGNNYTWDATVEEYRNGW